MTRLISESRPTSLFLFPLPQVVFFPATAKPLNIFEPRYVKMIDDAIETDTPVVLAYSDSMRNAKAREALAPIRRVAGAGRVKLLERRSDRTMLILLEGIGKVRLKGLSPSQEPYLVAETDWVEESNVLAEENLFLLNRLMKELVNWLTETVPDSEQREAFLSQLRTPEEKINYLCALLVSDPEHQQALLETDNLNDRLKAVSLVLDQEPLLH